LNSPYLIISPSGNFYGSEQVLFDYLNNTQISLQLYLPKNSLFESKLNEIKQKNFIKKGFNNVKYLYLEVAFNLLFKKYKSVYLNEAGHIKYIKILARIFPNVCFVVHIRLVEDTFLTRLKSSSANIKYVAVSKYILDELPVNAKLIYDPFPFSESKFLRRENSVKFIIGVIGRISKSKGLDKLIELAKSLKDNPLFMDFEFHLYGDQIFSQENIMYLNGIHSLKMIKLMGFVSDKISIYKDIDAVLHLCDTEPLGRIFLESINFGVPLIGFKAGGIGEIGELTNAADFLVAANDSWIPEIQKNLLLVKNNRDNLSKGMQVSKFKAMELFSLERYTRELDKLINAEFKD
jgi:glycosyltransferase involved in cell wall biosynthesis